MKRLLKKVFIAMLVFLLASTSAKRISAQSSPWPLKLKQILVKLEENTRDETLKKIIKDIEINYKKNLINEVLAERLLFIDSILTNSPKFNQQLTISYNKTLVQLFRQIPPQRSSIAYAKSLHNLAFKLEDLGYYPQSLSLYLKAAEIKRRMLGNENSDYAVSLNGLASIYERMGQYKKGLLMAEKASSIIKKVWGEDNTEFAKSLNIQAVLHEDLGQFDKMLPLVQRSLAIRRSILGEKHPAYAESLCKLADLYSAVGEYSLAIPLYEMDGAIVKETLGEEHPDYAYSLNNLAFTYEDMGRYDKALPLYQQALAIRKKALGEDHPYVAQSANNLAAVYIKVGQYEEGLKLFQRDSAITRRAVGVNHPDYALRLNSLAFLYKNLKQYQQALALVEQALAIHKKTVGEDDLFYCKYVSNLAAIYSEMEQYDKAINLIKLKFNIIGKRAKEQQAEYASTMVELAHLYQGKFQIDTSLSLYRKALTIYRKMFGEQHPDYIYSLSQLGLVYCLQGKVSQAEVLLKQASVLKIKYLKQTYSTLSEQEKITLISKEADLFSYLLSLVFYNEGLKSTLQQAYINELVLKGMVLEEQKTILHSIRQDKDSSLFHLYQDWRFNKVFLGKQQVIPLHERVDSFDSLIEVTNQLEQQLSRTTAAFHNHRLSQSIATQDISVGLSEGQAAVEFVRFPLYNKKWTDSIMYGALVLLPHDTVPKFVCLFEEKQLQALLELPLAASYTSIKKLYVSNSKDGGLNDTLYSLIWKPLEKYLINVHSVAYAPAGLLHRVAFQALRSDSTYLLIDKYQLVQMLSTRSVAFSAVLDKPSTAAVWGDIAYSSNNSFPSNLSTRAEANRRTLSESSSSFNFYTPDTREIRGKEWAQLPGTKMEIDSLQAVFKISGNSLVKKSGTEATEEEFKAMDGKSPKVLHLATHGFFLPFKESKGKDAARLTGGSQFTLQQNPMFRSGLVLAEGNRAWQGESIEPGKEDGILTAYEIAQMDLSNTDLVVLSACATALGDLQGNEGAVGLQRAFKMAGVKQIIVSLWQVPDLETAELMTLFYKNWLSGKSTREALRSAQLKMKEKHPSPFIWGAFVVVE